MAFCRLVFSLLVVSVISCYASNVPLYIWGDKISSPVHANPLKTLTPDDFLTKLHSKLADDQQVVVFYEEALSVEDFSRKHEDGETSFPYLHSRIGDAIYLSSVEDPLDVLNVLARKSKTDLELTDEDSFDVEEIPSAKSSEGKYVFIALQDAREKESRTSLLRRHDAFMQKTVSDLQKNGDVLAIYTALYPSWVISDAHSRVRRDVSLNGTVTSLDGLLLTVESISLMSGNETTPLKSLTAASAQYNDTIVTATLAFENQTSVTLNFISQAGYWFFESVGLNIGSVVEQLHPANEEVYAVLGFSYRCAQYVKFSTVNESRVPYTISFENLKVQPYFAATNASTQFGDSINCVGFFTAPIWAGLFVTFLLLAITFYGIMMMLDIRTMDRFDDPKGKTITINAE